MVSPISAFSSLLSCPARSLTRSEGSLRTIARRASWHRLEDVVEVVRGDVVDEAVGVGDGEGDQAVHRGPHVVRRRASVMGTSKGISRRLTRCETAIMGGTTCTPGPIMRS